MTSVSSWSAKRDGQQSSSSPSSSLLQHLHGSYLTVATCQLNQWALDFDGNCQRIRESCLQAKKAGAVYRLGPELEMSGYGCEDHFLEADTIHHCWESLIDLLVGNDDTTNDDFCGVSDGLLCDFGMPLLHRGIRYNCRVLCLDQQILMIRPKTALADNGNYRESRWFTAWDPRSPTEPFELPLGVWERLVKCTTGDKYQSRTVPFGLQSVSINGLMSFGCESCEELWTPQSTHISLALKGGIDIVGNGSGSHHELRKLHTRVDLITSATSKAGGIYLYANQRGCDGGRLYYDGCSMIVVNGRVVAQASQFSLKDVEVVTATVDLTEVRSYRASLPSLGVQAQQVQASSDRNGEDALLRFDTSTPLLHSFGHPTSPLPNGDVKYHSPEEECCLGPACWLWDYLRRSGASGYFLPLSGGADSSSVATIVGAMCEMVYEECLLGTNKQVLHDVRRICGKNKKAKRDGTETEEEEGWTLSSPQELASHVLHTTFMGTDHSSFATKSRAQRLSQVVGAYHLALTIDLMVSAVLKVFALATSGKTPRFQVNGGTMTEDLALQNIQARLRMVMAYLLAQLLPWVRGRSGFLLVLGSANVDEGLRGYMTKYDCSSADLNPIGGISKGDLKRMLLWAAGRYEGYGDVLREIAGAPPTAELRPQVNDTDDDKVNDQDQAVKEHSQLDEEEMGMTYDELGWFGRLRKISRCGPVSMYLRLRTEWYDRGLSLSEIATKVQRFFRFYSINRHKMCTITPSYHAEAYGPDDNRFDLRQFLYNTRWTRQFRVMDALVAAEEEEEQQRRGRQKEE